MAEPFSEDPEEIAKRRESEQRRLVLDYRATFQSEKGRHVMADLKRRFGWERWEAEDTENADLIARRVAAKGPIFHIEKMLRITFREGKDKPKRARSEDSKPKG